MAKKSDPDALKDELAEALAQVESLQSAAADAEARAATHADRIAALEADLQAARSESEGLAGRLRESALKYREARLAAAPHIPADLVTAEDFAGIDEQLAAAERVASQVREQMEKERPSGKPPSVPAGAPVRRAPDYSALPAGEKIKLGMQERRERKRL